MLRLFLLPAFLAAMPAAPFGTLPLNTEVSELRSRVQASPEAPIPLHFFAEESAAKTWQCQFHRLGPGPRFFRDMKLVLKKLPGGAHRDGFAVDAVIVSDVPAGESPVLRLFYDSHGHLVATEMLPRGTERSEKPGTREEFLVWRFLPATGELIGEWQRAVGPSLPKDPAWEGLPAAIVVDKQDPYSSYLRAAAYMSCRLAPLPGASAPSGAEGSGGTRQSAP
jgi:hypothetical protein